MVIKHQSSYTLVPTAAVQRCRRSIRLTTRAQSPVEFIPYTPVKEGDYFLRLYQPHAVARCAYQKRDAGYLALGSYMSGANASETRMVETQPIVMTYYPKGDKEMQVYLVPRGTNPKEAASAALPQPVTPEVTLDAGGGEIIAALRFEGYATEDTCRLNLEKLREMLKKDGLSCADEEVAGKFRLAQYGPLHSLQTRVNEIWLAVKL